MQSFSVFVEDCVRGDTANNNNNNNTHVQELVWILHKALEASQLEKRTCAEFLAETGEQERLELLRHRERQAADLRGRLEEAEAEAEALRRSLAQRDARLEEMQEEVRMLMEKNNAKQEVRTEDRWSTNTWSNISGENRHRPADEAL